MLKLENISFKEYVTLPVEDLRFYSDALRLGKFPGVDHFKVKNLFNQPWGFVKDMQEAMCVKGLRYSEFIDIHVEYGIIDPEQAYNMGIFHLQECVKWLSGKMEQINRAEKMRLTQSHVTAAEVNAGIDKLSVYRTFPQTDSLACGDPLKYDEVKKKLLYKHGFLKLAYDTSMREYHKKLYEILHPKPRKNKKS